MSSTPVRCEWAASDPINHDYHDLEWGVPLHDDHKLFELLILEGAQAGLSWTTILKKRDAYRKAYDGFNPEIVAKYDSQKKEELLSNPGIVRNRLKVEASIKNAKAFLDVVQEFGSFDRYIWAFVDHTPIQNQHTHLGQLPAETSISQQISKDLKKRGFKFVGPTIIYAFMQATGMVNDHTTDCFRHVDLS